MCVHGRSIWRGNWGTFSLLLGCCATAFVLSILPAVVAVAPLVGAGSVVVALVLPVVATLMLYASYRGFVWFWYERHAHLRAGKGKRRE